MGVIFINNIIEVLFKIMKIIYSEIYYEYILNKLRNLAKSSLDFIDKGIRSYLKFYYIINYLLYIS